MEKPSSDTFQKESSSNDRSKRYERPKSPLQQTRGHSNDESEGRVCDTPAQTDPYPLSTKDYANQHQSFLLPSTDKLKRLLERADHFEPTKTKKNKISKNKKKTKQQYFFPPDDESSESSSDEPSSESSEDDSSESSESTSDSSGPLHNKTYKKKNKRSSHKTPLSSLRRSSLTQDLLEFADKKQREVTYTKEQPSYDHIQLRSLDFPAVERFFSDVHEYQAKFNMLPPVSTMLSRRVQDTLMAQLQIDRKSLYQLSFKKNYQSLHLPHSAAIQSRIRTSSN